MRVVRRKKSIPRSFARHPAGREILAEADIGVTPRGALRAKLVVFRTPAALRRFWKNAMRSDLGRGCLGVVNGLAQEIITFEPGKPERHHVEVDPRYFCIIGLVRLTMEVISHEAAHAGFAYAKRRQGDYWREPTEMDEERVCYPAGRIAASINRFLHAKKLYPA